MWAVVDSVVANAPKSNKPLQVLNRAGISHLFATI